MLVSLSSILGLKYKRENFPFCVVRKERTKREFKNETRKFLEQEKEKEEEERRKRATVSPESGVLYKEDFIFT